MQPLEKNNLSTAENKELTSADISNTAALPNDVTSPPRLVIPPNRDGAVSPTGPIHQPPVSPLRQKSNSPGIIFKRIYHFLSFLTQLKLFKFLDIYVTSNFHTLQR